MNSKRKMFPSYTLLELLVVMAIFMILAGMGVGGFLGTRETMIARESVENIKQDIRSAKLKAMLLKKGDDSNWVYGIGIDFGDTNDVYSVFKWCSPFADFGNDTTKSSILAWDPTADIGVYIQDAYKNGYIPVSGYQSSCSLNQTNLVSLYGDISSGVVVDAERFQTLENVRFLVFEAITGRAFLYDGNGAPINYDPNNQEYDGSKVLDIVLTRRHSSKFDVISVYPLSGTVIHKVYSNQDRGCSSDEGDVCIFVDGVSYFRYSIADEINSYR